MICGEGLTSREASKTYLVMRWAILNDLCSAANGSLRRLRGLTRGMGFIEEEAKGCRHALNNLQTMAQDWAAERDRLTNMIHGLFPEEQGNWAISVGRPPCPESIALAQAEEMTAMVMGLLDQARSHNRMLEAMMHDSYKQQSPMEVLGF